MSLDPEQRFKDLREMGRELLLLAGQRTRITWGLSFGEAHPTLTSGQVTHAAGNQNGELIAARTPSSASRPG